MGLTDLTSYAILSFVMTDMTIRTIRIDERNKETNIGGENVYHIGLELTPDQVKKLKQLALDKDLKVKDLVTSLVVTELSKENKNKNNKNFKEE